VYGDGKAEPVNYPWLCGFESTNTFARLKGDFGNSPDLLEYSVLRFNFEMRIYEVIDAEFIQEFQQQGFPRYTPPFPEHTKTSGTGTKQFEQLANFNRRK